MSFFGPIIKVVNSMFPQKPALKDCYSESWYFSSEGKSAYESLSSVCEKTLFFMNYLRCIQNKKNNPDVVEILYKIAFVMSNSMVDSNLEFGGYPNILNQDKNPFVYYVKHNLLNHEYVPIYCEETLPLVLLKLLHYGPDNKSDNADIPYGIITFCEENEPISDMYKIERDIISVCSVWLDIKVPPAYSFALSHITKSSSVKDTDENLDEELDEDTDEDIEEDLD